MTGPESFESTNSEKKMCKGAPTGYSAKYRAYSEKVNRAKATEKASEVKAGCGTHWVNLVGKVCVAGDETHINRNPWNEHDDRERVEKLAAHVEAGVNTLLLPS